MLKIKILRLLFSAVIGFMVIWAAAPMSVSAYDSMPPGQDVDFVMVDDYWPMEDTGPGTLIYASTTLRYAIGPADGNPAGYVWQPSGVGDMSWADQPDRKWTQFVNPNYGVWDLGASFSEVAVFPYQDHGPYPAEGLEHKIWGSNDFDASNPGAATWVAADLDRVYRKGWSNVGEGIYETCNDDYVAVWDWKPGPGAGDCYRFVKLQSIWAAPYNEPEIDSVNAVAGTRCGPGPGRPCDWQTTIVDRGKTFSYTSLAIGYDGKVHIAFGEEELYYALWDGYTWQEQEIESGGVGAYCSLALDNTGKPCISYYDAANGNLKYARWNGTSWDIQTVDSVGDVGRYTSLAFDGSGKPAISYYDVTNENLRYARWNGTSWVKETVDSVGDVGAYTSLAFNDISHNPAISYYDATNGNLKYAEKCPNWKIETVDSAGDVGSHSSLAFDGLGNPAISYHDATNGDLKYAKKGASWIRETVDSEGWVGWYTSLELDSSDNPAISYYDASNGDLKYARWNGTSWDIETVDSSGDVGAYTSLAFDVSGKPGISYYDATNDYVKYAYWDGATWHKETVYSISDVGRYTSLAFDSWGNPAISYYDVRHGDLKYAHWNGVGWDIETVDSAGDVGQYTSLALDSLDNPAISYYDATNSNLKYAHWNGTVWVKETVDSAGDVGQYTSLALDSLGNPAISYYDASNDDLKYAHFNGAVWNKETVDGPGDVGRYTSLALGGFGSPAISYYDATNGNLKYAYKCCDSTIWVIETVDSIGDVGLYTSLAFDCLYFPCLASGNPAISYFDASNGDLKYAHWNDTKWDIETVDSEGWVGLYTSLAFDSCCGVTGNPAISYYDASNGDLKYAHWNGTVWVKETVDSAGWAGWYTSLAFTTSGTPAISYGEATHQHLKYAYIPVECAPCPGPDRPSNIWPPDGAAGVSLTPALCSSPFSFPEACKFPEACEGPTHVASQWQITCSCRDFSSPVFDSGRDTVNLVCIVIPPGKLDKCTTYCWRVRHQDNCGRWSAWSEETAFTTFCEVCPLPGTPSNPSPANHATDVSVNADLDWSGTDTESYDVYFGTSSSPAIYGNTSSSSYSLPTLEPSTKYYWKIVAKNDCGSTPGPVWDFTTGTEVCPTPGKPSNPSPADHATDVPVNADLDWSDSANTDSYDVYFGDSSPPAYYGNTSSSSYLLPTLQPNTKYYWKIVAKNDCGSTEGDVWEFTTAPCLIPGKPSDPSPADGATDVSINADLDWYGTNTDSYDVYFGDSSPPALYGNTSSSNYSLPILQPNTKYYWKIVAKNDCGSTEGDVWEFTTVPYGAPNRPINICPTPGSTGVGLTPTLMSSDFSDPDPGDTHAASQWQIRTSAGTYSPPVWDSGRDTENLTSIVVPAETLEYNTTYYFHVRHQDNHGNWSSYSEETFFTTHRPPIQPSNISPVDGATGVSLTPTLVCSGFSDPDGDFHAASQWQIRTATGDYDSPVYNSGTSSKLTHITIPSGILSYNTTYYWRVRHEDHLGGWSSYSSETSFTTVAAPTLQADFTASRTAVIVGQSVQFTSLSSGGVPLLNYKWDFDDDGNWDSTLEDPSYAYPAAGNYTVVLKVTDSALHTDTERKLDYVTVYAPPEADFAADETELIVGQSVQFTSLSSGGVPLLNYKWDFDNDGDWDSTLENPSYTYLATGKYTVVLKVTDSAANTDTETKVEYITVALAPPPPVNQPPDRPSNVSPADEATDVSLTRTLMSSAFADPDEGDTHAASQWQVRSSTGDYLDPVWDSGRDTGHLTSISVPSGKLHYNTTYYWRVRYEDNHGAWSSWSAETSFTTEEEAVGLPFWVWIAIGVGAVIILALGIIFGRGRAGKIMSKALGTVFYS